MTDIARDPFPEAEAAVTRRVREILAAVEANDVDRPEGYHLFGPKHSKFVDGDPAGRQDAATAQRLERELVLAAEALRFRAEDLKVNASGPVAVATFVLDWAATMPDGQEFASRSRATLVLGEDADDWKLTHEHFSVFPGTG